MTPRDYREAWGWVDLLLNGPEPARSLFLTYLGESGRATDPSALSSRLTTAGVTTDRLLAYLKDMQSGAVASRPGGVTNSLRLQDRPIEQPQPATRRGIFGRLRAWLGL
jgi:hypothetical protein